MGRSHAGQRRTINTEAQRHGGDLLADPNLGGIINAWINRQRRGEPLRYAVNELADARL